MNDTTIIPAAPHDKPDHTHNLSLTEVRMSDCPFGCKFWRCDGCGEETLLHSPTYGCRGAA